MEYIGSLNPAEGIKGAKFKSQDYVLRVIWATENELTNDNEAVIAIDPDSREVRVIDSMGNLLERYERVITETGV